MLTIFIHAYQKINKLVYIFQKFIGSPLVQGKQLVGMLEKFDKRIDAEYTSDAKCYFFDLNLLHYTPILCHIIQLAN